MLCCAFCGTGVGRGKRVTAECNGGVMYQVWGPQPGVIPIMQFRVSWRYRLDDHILRAMSHGKRGLEDFCVVCCACHRVVGEGDIHRDSTDFACHKCTAVTDEGFRNVRHRERVVQMLTK